MIIYRVTEPETSSLPVLGGFWYSPCAGVGSEMDRDFMRTKSMLEEGAVDVGGRVPEWDERWVLVVVEVFLVVCTTVRKWRTRVNFGNPAGDRLFWPVIHHDEVPIIKCNGIKSQHWHSDIRMRSEGHMWYVEQCWNVTDWRLLTFTLFLLTHHSILYHTNHLPAAGAGAGGDVPHILYIKNSIMCARLWLIILHLDDGVFSNKGWPSSVFKVRFFFTFPLLFSLAVPAALFSFSCFLAASPTVFSISLFAFSASLPLLTPSQWLSFPLSWVSP